MSEPLIREEIYTQVSRRLDITREDTKRVVDAALDVISDGISNLRVVHLRQFGVFDFKARKRRIGHNPSNREEKVEIPAHQVVWFRPCKTVRGEVLRKTVDG